MKNAKLIFLLVLVLSSFDKANDRIRLIFEEEKGMRSSFCMYSDGRFYETRPSGCVGQEFASGVWETKKDTVKLIYKTGKTFDFEVFNSLDTSSKLQIVRIIDCYNQPVRFQDVCFDTTCQNLFNPGLARIEKGKSILYFAPIFEQNGRNVESVISNADTITYKWLCNRESIESISGGTLYINQEQSEKRVYLRNKRVIQLSQ
jgi:hypothetical protein